MQICDFLANQVIWQLKKSHSSVCVAESFTGGLITYYLSKISGASEVLQGGVVSYSNDSKMKILNVPMKTIHLYDAVSMECVLQMLQGALKLFNTDFALASSGFAGPSGEDVGRVFLGILHKSGKNQILQYRLKGSRTQIQTMGSKQILKDFLDFSQKIT